MLWHKAPPHFCFQCVSKAELIKALIPGNSGLGVSSRCICVFHLHASGRWIQARRSVFTGPVTIHASEACGEPRTLWGLQNWHQCKKNHSSEALCPKENSYVLPVSDDDETNWGLLCWKWTLRTFILQIVQGWRALQGRGWTRSFV